MHHPTPDGRQFPVHRSAGRSSAARAVGMTTAVLAVALMAGTAALLHARQPAAPPAATETFPPEAYAAVGDEAAGPVKDKTPRSYNLAAAADRFGRVWVGTDQQGAWCYDPRAGAWTQFRPTHDLGDDSATSFAVDKKGRTWVGHLAHGVSVYDGADWRTFDVLDGPLGGRVLGLAVCPTTGDVWMATDHGLTIYSVDRDAWSYVTKADGLPGDELRRIAFDPAGNVYVATECDGVTMADAADGYAAWRTVQGPSRPPAAAHGDGLPGTMLDDVLVATDGTVYLGCNDGLARSHDRGKTWTFDRGNDWVGRIKLRSGGPPAGFDPATADPGLMTESAVTCLAEDPDGRIWLGHLRKGYEILDPKTDHIVDSMALTPSSDTAVLAPPGMRPMVATFGGGFSLQSSPSGAAVGELTVAQLPATPPPMPSPAASPTAEAIAALAKRVATLPTAKTVAAYDGEDPATEGDWCGRYGRQGWDRPWTSPPMPHQRLTVKVHVGPHEDRTAKLYPVRVPGTVRGTWFPDFHNPKALYDPFTLKREFYELNDGSFPANDDIYGPDFEGPDLMLHVTVPPGVHRVSLFLENNDGHDGGSCRFRDHLVELKPDAPDLVAADAGPTLARTRVDFFYSNTVYKRFVLSGGSYWIKLGRNYNNCVKYTGMFCDDWADAAGGFALPGSAGPAYAPPPADAKAAGPAGELWMAIDANPATAAAGLDWPARIAAYRSAASRGGNPDLLAAWRWSLPIWNKEDADGFRASTASAAKGQKAEAAKADLRHP